MEKIYSTQNVIFASKLQEYLIEKQDSIYERLKEVLSPLNLSKEEITEEFSLDLYFNSWHDTVLCDLHYNEDNLFYNYLPNLEEQVKKAIYFQILEDFPELEGKSILVRK